MCSPLLVVLFVLVDPGAACETCHSRQVSAYRKTGMGRSVSRPAREIIEAQEVRHATSNSVLNVSWRSNQLLHSVTRNGKRAAYPVTWTIGSGNEGKSYLIQVGDALFQSPISWYATRKIWDLSPGYQSDSQLDFFRPVTQDCLFCHAGSSRPREGTLNRYLDPPFEKTAIDCDRCHGNPAVHIAKPERSNIINPKRLEPQRRDAVCEQCHLSGEARIPNPGKKFSDYLPGMRLEDAFSVYVKQSAGDPQGLKVVSHSEQMVKSRCFLESGQKMWCGTCHDPHAEIGNRAFWYRDKCLECHQNSAASLHQKTAGEDCAGCHMPKTQSYDGGHTAFHDHWIRIDRSDSPSTEELQLRAWRTPDKALQNRNLGLAYISAGSKGNDRQLQQGFQLLQTAGNDGDVETARGMVLLRAGKVKEALSQFQGTSEKEPQNSTRRLNLAAALLAIGNRAEAKRNAEIAIELEPLLEDAYALLAEIEPARAAYWKNRYLTLVPQRVLP